MHVDLAPVISKAHRLGSGLYSTAYQVGGVVVKKARCSEGTRNWLEFCALAYEAGINLPIMPVVYAVIPVYNELGHDAGYYAIMEPLTEQDILSERVYRDWGPNHIQDQPFYAEARAAYDQYLKAFEGNEYWTFNDVHSGNIMMRGTQPVITDPECCDYRQPKYQEFTLC